MNYTIITINGTEFYTFEAEYFENEGAAEVSGYYWDDEVEKWTKEIVNEQTTAF